MTDAWTTLLERPAWRGELAGYTGTAILEEADEDERVARFRLQGIRDGATATATLIVDAGVELELHAVLHPGHGSDLTADQVVAAVRDAWARAEAPVAAPPDQVAPAAHDAAARRRRALVAAGAAAALAAWALKGRR